MADDYDTRERDFLLSETLFTPSNVFNAALSNSIVFNSAFMSPEVDEKPERDQLFDSLDDWSDDRFSSFYRMAKRKNH